MNPEDIPGWMTPVELAWLREQASKRFRIAEIGSYLGRSTAAIAITPGVVYAIDDWRGPRDIGEPLCENDKLYLQFCENLKTQIAAGKVKPVRVDHASWLDFGGFDFVFIDGSHEYEDVKRDIATSLARLSPGGLLAGHDAGIVGVSRAIAELPWVGLVKDTSIWFYIKESK